MVDRFKELMKTIGISQKALAEAVGIHPNSLTEFAQGRTKTLSQEVLVYLNTEFGVNLKWLVYGKGDMFLTETSHGYRPPLNPLASLDKPERKVVEELIAVLAKHGAPVAPSKSEAYPHKDFREAGLIASIAAGNPAEAIEHPEEVFYLPRKLFRQHGKLFMLKVRGDSMIGAGIYDGDLVIMERVEDIHAIPSGQIIAITLDGAATLKRLLRSNGDFILHAENPNYPDRELTAKEFPVLWGRFIALVRQ